MAFEKGRGNERRALVRFPILLESKVIVVMVKMSA